MTSKHHTGHQITQIRFFFFFSLLLFFSKPVSFHLSVSANINRRLEWEKECLVASYLSGDERRTSTDAVAVTAARAVI